MLEGFVMLMLGRAPTFVQKSGKAYHIQALKDVKARYPDIWVPNPS